MRRKRAQGKMPVQAESRGAFPSPVEAQAHESEGQVGRRAEEVQMGTIFLEINLVLRAIGL